MPWSRFDFCQKCCGGCDSNTIGFDETAWPGLVDCYTDVTVIENLKDDINKLQDCCVVFMGNNNQCSDSIRFPSNQWNDIKEWVEAGGRLWINAEYGGPFPCLKDPETLAAFLGTLGVDLGWEDGQYDCGCREDFMLPGEAGIAFFLINQQMGCTAEISGFKTAFYSPVAQVPMICVDQLGDGFVFLCGDSNIWGGCDYDNCNLANRILNRPDSQII